MGGKQGTKNERDGHGKRAAHRAGSQKIRSERAGDSGEHVSTCRTLVGWAGTRRWERWMQLAANDTQLGRRRDKVGPVGATKSKSALTIHKPIDVTRLRFPSSVINETRCSRPGVAVEITRRGSQHAGLPRAWIDVGGFVCEVDTTRSCVDSQSHSSLHTVATSLDTVVTNHV